MARWGQTIDIKRVLFDDALTLAQKAERVQSLLNRTNIDPDTLEELVLAGEDNDVEAFDGVLTTIYDWADAERVWLGV